MPIPFRDCTFTLDGTAYQGIDKFIDRLLSKDIRVTPDQEAIDMARAKEFGFDHPAEAIGSVNKRLGLKETEQKEIRVMEEDAKLLKSVSDTDGILHELFGAGDKGIVRMKDIDSGEVISLKKFPSFDQAEKEYEKNTKLSEPAVREPYKFLKDIPDEELRQAAKERKSEAFDKKVDDFAKRLTDTLSAKLPEGTQKSGVGIAEIIQKGADIIKAAYHAGQDIKEAIGKAIDYIKDNWDKAWGEFDEATVADHMYEAGALSIDEEIETRFGLTPQEVLDIWNSSDAGRNNPELLDFVQKLSSDEKKEIVKNALKGIVSDKLNKFIKVVKQKTGNKIDIMDKAEFKQAVDDKIKEELRKEMEKRTKAKEQLDEAIKKSQQSKPLLTQIKNSAMVDKVMQVIKGIGLAFHPAMFEGKELARDAMMLIRKEKGKEAHANELADIASRDLMNKWNWVPKLDKLGFILSLENAKKYGTADPLYKKIADQYRQRMDAVFEMISKIKDVPYLEDYFPHFWEKPERARAHFAQVYSKRSFEGNKSFLKQRFYSDILQGLEAGLKLATDNPEEIVRLAEINALKFKTAHDVFAEMHSRGLIKFFKNGVQPEGWKLVNDPLFKRMALFTVKGEDGKDEAAMSSGGWYMPEPVARVVNNYLSRGISGAGPVGKNVFEAARGWNNFKNLFQLGMGAFHLTTTTVDSTVTGVANAVSKILAGKPQGLIDLVNSITLIPNIAKTLAKGHEGIMAYRATTSTSGDVQSMVDANGRTGLSKIYTLDSWYNLKKAVGKLYADKDFSQLPSAIKNALLLLPEAAAKPLMEWYVPRLKVGGYLRTLEHELSLKKGLTDRDVLREKQRIWDDMDDRLGQMVYDNLFWHKTMKDIAFMTIRSFGWTGGTIRAFGKGIGEAPESAKRLVKGEGLSPRTAWLLSLPVTVGAYGAMYQYMMTGQGPQELKDYFFPKDGTKNPDGTDHRVSIPSYMKDLFAYKRHPFETLAHKTAPSVNEAIEIFSNKDFYGTQIFNPKDPIYKKGLELLEYEAQSLIPFSFKQQQGAQPNLRQSIEQKFGIMPATKEFQRTDTQNTIVAEVSKAFGDEVKTQSDAERYAARREIRERLFAGESPSNLKPLFDKAGYSSKTKDEVIKDARLDPYKRMFRDLKSEQQLTVWSKMTEDEKKEYTEYLNNKDSFEQLHENKPEFFDEETEKAYQEIVKKTHETRGGPGQHKQKPLKVL
jgi:hypothetical protein